MISSTTNEFERNFLSTASVKVKKVVPCRVSNIDFSAPVIIAQYHGVVLLKNFQVFEQHSKDTYTKHFTLLRICGTLSEIWLECVVVQAKHGSQDLEK